jgi:hypothetical protein
VSGYEAGSAYLTIIPSAKGFSRNLRRELDGQFDAYGTRAGDRMADGAGKSKGFAALGGKVGGLFVAGFAAVGASQIARTVVDFITGAVDSASNLGETTSKVGQIFGDAQGAILAFAKTADESLGQSMQTALDGAATFGIFGTSAGLAGEDLAAFSIEMVTLATDLASFNNTSPEDAILAIGSALRGEAEPIRAYGVLLDDATLKNRALALGLIETTTGALTPQQKVLAAHAEILAQTALQQGDFARTSDGMANRQRILTAAIENTKAEIGTALLPVVNDLFGVFVETGLPLLQDMAAWFSENKDTVRELAITTTEAVLTIVQMLLLWGQSQSTLAFYILSFTQVVLDVWTTFIDSLLSGAERAFGWIPGLGEKLKTAREKFGTWSDDVHSKFDEMREGAGKAAETFEAGAEAVGMLKDKVSELDGRSATVTLNAQGNLLDQINGIYRVRGTGVEFRASGGAVRAGQPYIVGEREAELFVPDTSGTIFNQSQLAGMGRSTVFNVTSSADAPLAQHYAREVADANVRAWQDAVAANLIGDAA